VPGEWPGTWTHLERDARRLDGLAAGEERRLAGERARRIAREEVVRPAEDVELALGQPDRRARSLREVGEGAEVVEVAVREQDRGAGRSRAGEREPDLGGVRPGSITTAWVAPRSARTR
jgi:hypothetical protein